MMPAVCAFWHLTPMEYRHLTLDELKRMVDYQTEHEGRTRRDYDRMHAEIEALQGR